MVARSDSGSDGERPGQWNVEREPLLAGEGETVIDLRTARAPRRLPSITDDDLQGLNVSRSPGGGGGATTTPAGTVRSTPVRRAATDEALSSEALLSEGLGGTSGGAAYGVEGVESNDNHQGVLRRRYSRAPGGYAPNVPSTAIRRRLLSPDFPPLRPPPSVAGPSVSLYPPPLPPQLQRETGVVRLAADRQVAHVVVSRGDLDGSHSIASGIQRQSTDDDDDNNDSPEDPSPEEVPSTVALLRALRARLQGIDPALSTARATLAETRANMAEIRTTTQQVSERQRARRTTLMEPQRGTDHDDSRIQPSRNRRMDPTSVVAAQQRSQGTERSLTPRQQLPSPSTESYHLQQPIQPSPRMTPLAAQPAQIAQYSSANNIWSSTAPAPDSLPSDSMVPNRHPHPPTPEPPEVQQPTAVPPSSQGPPTNQAPTPSSLAAHTSATIPKPGLPAWLKQLRGRVANRTQAMRHAHQRPTRLAPTNHRASTFSSQVISQATLTRAMDVLVAGQTMDRCLIPLAAVVDLVALHLVLTAHLHPSTLRYVEDAPLPVPQPPPEHKTNEPKRLHLTPLQASQSIDLSDTAALARYDISGLPALPLPQDSLPIGNVALCSRAQHLLRATIRTELIPVEQKLSMEKSSWDPVWELSCCTDLLDGGIAWRTMTDDAPLSDSVPNELEELRAWWSHTKLDLSGGVSPTHLQTLPGRLLASRTLVLLRHLHLRLDPPPSPVGCTPTPSRNSSLPLLDLTRIQLTRTMDHRSGARLVTRDVNQAIQIRSLPAPLGMRYDQPPTHPPTSTVPSRTLAVQHERDQDPLSFLMKPSAVDELPKIHIAVFVTPKVVATPAYRLAVLQWVKQHKGSRQANPSSYHGTNQVVAGGRASKEESTDQELAGKKPSFEPGDSKSEEGTQTETTAVAAAAAMHMVVEPWAEFVFQQGSLVATNVERNTGDHDHHPRQTISSKPLYSATKMTASQSSSSSHHLHPHSRSAKTALASRIAARQAENQGSPPPATTAVAPELSTQASGDEKPPGGAGTENDTLPIVPGTCATDAGTLLTLVAWGQDAGDPLEDALDGVRVEAFGFCGPRSLGS